MLLLLRYIFVVSLFGLPFAPNSCRHYLRYHFVDCLERGNFGHEQDGIGIGHGRKVPPVQEGLRSRAGRALTEIVTNALKVEDKVQLVGFGSFEMKNRAPRTGRNFGINEPVEIPTTKLSAFKASKVLKDAIQ